MGLFAIARSDYFYIQLLFARRVGFFLVVVFLEIFYMEHFVVLNAVGENFNAACFIIDLAGAMLIAALELFQIMSKRADYFAVCVLILLVFVEREDIVDIFDECVDWYVLQRGLCELAEVGVVLFLKQFSVVVEVAIELV